MKLYDVWMIHLRQNSKLFFKQLDIFLDTFFENTLDRIFDEGIGDPMCNSDWAEVTASYKFLKRVDCSDVSGRECVLNLLEDLGGGAIGGTAGVGHGVSFTRMR